MSSVISETARELAAQLARQFCRDTELAKRLADAQHRLERANHRLWRGVHADGLAAVYGEQADVINMTLAENRSEVLGAPDPLTALQQVQRSIRSAFTDCQTTAEERRQLAADTGETIRQLVDALVAAGWSEQQAKSANVHQLALIKPATRRSN